MLGGWGLLKQNGLKHKQNIYCKDAWFYREKQTNKQNPYFSRI